MMPPEIPLPDEFETVYNQASRIAYVKLRDRSFDVIRGKRFVIDRNAAVPKEVQDLLATLPVDSNEDAALESRMDFLSEIATRILDRFQNHQPLLFLFSNNWRTLRIVGTAPADRVEKCIFWRSAAELVMPSRIEGIVWVSEVWLREMKTGVHIDKTKIMREALSMLGLTRNGRLKQRTWEIIRTASVASLGEREDRELDRKTEALNFLVPIMRAMGLTDSATG